MSLSLSGNLPILIVDLVTVTRSIDNVQSETYTMLFNHCDRRNEGDQFRVKYQGFFGTGASSGKAKRCEKLNDIPKMMMMMMMMVLTMTNILNLGSLTWRFIRVQAALAVNEMRGKNRVHKCGLAETRLTYTTR